MAHNHELLKGLAAGNRQLREHIGPVYDGFSQMSRAAMSDGELPSATKELIALAISVVEECDGCIASHARGAARRGATAPQVAEAIGVAILMSGGPGTVYGPRAWAAYHEFVGESSSGSTAAAGR